MVPSRSLSRKAGSAAGGRQLNWRRLSRRQPRALSPMTCRPQSPDASHLAVCSWPDSLHWPSWIRCDAQKSHLISRLPHTIYQCPVLIDLAGVPAGRCCCKSTGDCVVGAVISIDALRRSVGCNDQRDQGGGASAATTGNSSSQESARSVQDRMGERNANW